jgi:integrase/recombinase XerD
LGFLNILTHDHKQATKRNRYSTLTSFFNFTINTALPTLQNPCSSPVLKKIFKRPKPEQWKILDKESVDEIIFRTHDTRNRIVLELMARGGMRIGEVLRLTPNDIANNKLIIRKPKSGRETEVVFIPGKLLARLKEYVTVHNIGTMQKIFPISYTAAWSMVKKAGRIICLDLRPHDPRRHAATYASRSGIPLEIVSKIILRHANLSTTQRYLGNVNDSEAVRWIENLHG